MKRVPPSPRPPSRESLKAISYDATTAAKPPITLNAPPPPPKPSQRGFSGLRLPKIANQRLSPRTAQFKLQNDVRRDSGLAPSSFTSRDSRTTLGSDVDSTSSIKHSPSLPSFSAPDETFQTQTPKSGDKGQTQLRSPEAQNDSSTIPRPSFLGLLTEIPTGNFEDLTIPGHVEFSKRGSMLIGGKKANNANGGALSHGRLIGSRRQPSGSLLAPTPNVPLRVLSADDEALSFKVRSMYDGRGDTDSDWVAGIYKRMGNGKIPEETSNLRAPSQSTSIPEILTNGVASHPSPSQAGTTTSNRESASVRENYELAGGIEDWEDLKGGDVDRYGFIVPRKLTSQASSLNSFHASSPEPPRIQRVSTLLQIASETPRKGRIKNPRSAKSPTRSVETPSMSRPPSGIVRPTSSQSSYRTINGKESKIRSAANRLPHNKDRRCVDEAGDMLTLPPGLADIAEDEEDGKAVDSLKKREWEREEKWRKMAKIVKNDKHGGGMVFEFDTKSAKVMERTWKGIPDRWRATAWHAFMTTSAKKRRGSPSDNELIAVFTKLVDQGSPDDVQIDIDVPRTINSHIMFRRRYRGGQRLLFRVLHCLSIYFPDTGYVQGMAALAATLLCYFDEEMTFVMLVRLWQLRGLERLYQSGFEGLMQALEEFEKDWMGKGEVAARLVSPPFCIQIASLAYGCPRLNSASPPPPTAHAGTSPSSTTPSPSPHSSASGTSSCSSAIRTHPFHLSPASALTHQIRRTPHPSMVASTSCTPLLQLSSMVRERSCSTPTSRMQ